MRGMTDQNPSDALTRRRRPLRAVGIAAAGIIAVGALGYGGVAIAQTFTPAPEPTPTAEVADLPVNLPPVAVIVATTTDLTVTLDGSTSTDDGTILSYVWNFGDSNVGTGATTSHTYGAAGTYTVTLLITDNGSLTGLTTAVVTVTAPPPPPDPEPPVAPTYGNYPPGYPMPRIPGTDQPDTGACASSAGMTDANGNQVCA